MKPAEVAATYPTGTVIYYRYTSPTAATVHGLAQLDGGQWFRPTPERTALADVNTFDIDVLVVYDPTRPDVPRIEYGIRTTDPETGDLHDGARGTRGAAERSAATIHRWRGPHTPATIIRRWVCETRWEIDDTPPDHA